VSIKAAKEASMAIIGLFHLGGERLIWAVAVQVKRKIIFKGIELALQAKKKSVHCSLADRVCLGTSPRESALFRVFPS